ncbi:YqeG family HAD IIIA-type phosphatase [Shouchella patagoniensis]|uniref:YqeG family HAD IIIA-type phosphatase n=1 Tax=Shouchella patagoniensis TaxID=228576 RepID=UPI000995A808|nr:YqeG family HAD IIIA-type phosphatase [Shouchella patagoniensis]
MFSQLLPNQYVKSIYDIDLDALKNRGIRAVITDLDNTLVEWHREEATPEVKNWFTKLEETGLNVTIVSNNTEKRVKAFCDPEQKIFIHGAKKPSRKAFRKACKQMDVRTDEAVVIGDQIFTDVLGGNRAGLFTILVVPVAKTDGWMTQLNRRMERIVLRWMKKKGQIHWEE